MNGNGFITKKMTKILQLFYTLGEKIIVKKAKFLITKPFSQLKSI